jgi:uncharacterized membrane protein
MAAREILFWLPLGAGVLAAAAALYGRYAVLPAVLTGPRICKLEANGCAVLFRTETAALLGVPNSALGLLCMAILAAGRLVGAASGALLIVIAPAVIMSLYLMVRLLRDQLECRVCWIGNISNLLIGVVLAIETFGR